MRRPAPFARREITTRCLLALLIVVLGAVGCGELAKVNMVSTEQELALGKQFSQEMEAKDIKIYEDAEVSAYIDSLGQLLARNSDRNDIPYIIKVVDTDEVNAFAIPGGYLYVNRGLIVTAENESELAGVMGHEIGHVVGRHSAKQMTREYGLGMIAGIALGNNPNQLSAMAANLAGSGTLLKYGRDAELEADAFGVDETYRSGIDPAGMATFFEKLLALQGTAAEGNWLDNLFSTHPPTKERIDKARAKIAGLPPKPGLVKDSPRFQEIKQKLPAIQKG
jgi:predicted Zn-dependent protease